jgi:hypothetical protein
VSCSGGEQVPDGYRPLRMWRQEMWPRQEGKGKGSGLGAGTGAQHFHCGSCCLGSGRRPTLKPEAQI